MPRVARAVRAVPIVAMMALTGLIGLVPSVAPAQTGPQAAPPPPDTAAPVPAASSAPHVVVPATGYGWSTKPSRPWRGRVRATRAAASSNISPSGTVIPGFEILADGTSRVFVQMPKPVTYNALPAKGSITYVLKGVKVDRRNNLNALVTVHFNTPVTSARLVPHGGDLWFVVNLRASVQPTVTMDATKDGGAMLRVEFPKGDFIPSATSPAPDASPAAAPAPTASGSAAPATPAPSP